MINFPVINDDKDVIYNLPTSLKEISSEYLLGVTADVAVADHYSLVGLVYVDKLTSIILAGQRKDKKSTVGVVPIFIKAGRTDSDFIKGIKTGEKLVMSNTQLSMGYNVIAPKNELNLDKFLKNVLNDKQLPYQRAFEKYPNDLVHFISFKLIPNNDIIGVYSESHEVAPYESFVEIHDKAGA